MKYGRIEARKAKENAREQETAELARLYAEADSMSEFRLKADAAGLGRSRYMKWFRLYYFLENLHPNARRAFPCVVFSPVVASAVVGLIFGVEAMSKRSGDLGWQSVCALTFIASAVAVVGLGVAAAGWIVRALNRVNDAVWLQSGKG